ncbi:MAG: hypothetical protein MSC55_01400 [Faecalibacterium sp.]|nr:hypothetical protein [Faecalibacterium sp.]
MKEVNKGILDNDMVITAENIQKIGEVIALTCIKTVIIRSGKDLHYLYKGLLRDMNRSKEDNSPFSNAYDIAQEAMLFLCQHISEKLGDDYTTKYGKVVTIKSACYRCADNYLQKQYTRHIANSISLDERITAESETILDDEQRNDYTAFDRLISKMKLTAVESETLSILMAGFTMIQIGKILNVNRSTIWRRQNGIRKKYLQVTNAL